MADAPSGPNWFPTPPPKPLEAPSAAKVGLGVLVVVLVVAGGAVALSNVGRSSHKTATTPIPKTRGVATPTREDRRQAFEDCMKSMGAGTPAAPRSRFGGGGPSQRFRDAFGVCRSLLQTGALDPVAPTGGGTGTTVAPAA